MTHDQVKCPRCIGGKGRVLQLGVIRRNRWVTCPVCKGQGKVPAPKSKAWLSENGLA